MEIQETNACSENALKEPEVTAVAENSSIGLKTLEVDVENSKIVEEIDRETRDSKETRDSEIDRKMSEINEIPDIEKASTSRELEVTLVSRVDDESGEITAASINSQSREKTPEIERSKSEIIETSTDDKVVKSIAKKHSQCNDTRENMDSFIKEEMIIDKLPKVTKSPIEIREKSKTDDKSVITEALTSGRSETPEIIGLVENPKIIDDTEDDLENGQGDEEIEEINDEEIVDREDDEECPANVDPPEVGIVGPPTAVRDLINDEELGTTESSSLPSDTRNNEITKSKNRAPDVAEWIERSRLTNDTKDKITISKTTTRRRKQNPIDVNAVATIGPSRKSQKIVTSIIRRSIKCLNKMHAAAEYGSGGTTVKKLETVDKREEDSRGSPKVPQSRQNGAALPEETATAMATSASVVNSERLRPTVKSENHSDTETETQSAPIDCPRSRRRSIDEIPSESRNSRKKSPTNSAIVRNVKNERNNGRKRRSTDDALATNCGQPFAKKICFAQRERFIESLIGTSERISAEELATRADELRAEVQALDELARAKEMEWNEILSMRKLKEEAYLRIERRRQVVGYMESNGQISENLPPASLSLVPEWESSAIGTTTVDENTTRITCQESASSREVKEIEEVRLIEESQRTEETSREISPLPVAKRDKTLISIKSSNSAQRRTSSPKQLAENGRKQQQQQQQQQQRNQQQQQQQQRHHQQQFNEQQTLDNRQIGEGRQGPIVDVRSIIADYRLRHPETVPRRYDNKKESPARQQRETSANTRTSGLINVRRGRRMRNSVNIGLGAGGAMVETTNVHHSVDSRPSSTDSCKSTNERTTCDPNNSMSFKDVLVQFAKLSQQQGEPVKTPQNYPDVTLHPVAPTTVTINSAPSQQIGSTGSLLHGILTKSQSPRPTTFSPTLARLLTAPERERTNVPTSITAIPQQNIQTQHLLQTYQGSNPVSISDLLSSSKARTEITITPVVTPITPIHTSQSNSLIHVDDVEEDTSLIDERDSRLGSGGRDSRDERDSPPRCQGCQERAAQFVCAGCGNQWYCSRDCQVAAWDEHSEVCSG